MTVFEQTLLREVAALPEARRADVLAFVRYLRITLMDEDAVNRQYDLAVQRIRETAEQYDITEDDVAAEISAVRARHASRS